MLPTFKESPSVWQLTSAQVQAIIWARRRVVLAVTITGLVSGILYAFLSPVDYRADVSIMPELQTRSALTLKRFGALAELAGIDLDATANITDAVRPDLYPNVLASRPFILYILNQPVETTTHQQYPTLVAFLTDPGRFWLNRLFGINALTIPQQLSNRQLLTLSIDQEDLLKSMQERILSDLDKQSGLILIRVELPDANVAAQVAQLSADYLKQYIIDYRTGKLQENLTFLINQLQETKNRHDTARRQLARYLDEHRYTVLQTALLEAHELEANVNVARTVLDDLTRQFEQTRLRIQEQTPIFKVLEPPHVPARRSSPRRKWIVLIFTVVSFFAGACWVWASTKTGNVL